MGRTIEDALARSRDDANSRTCIRTTCSARRPSPRRIADRYFARTRRRSTPSRFSREHDSGLPVFARPGISIKLSALHPRYEYAQRARALAELTPRIEALAARARRGDVGVTLDAEEAERLGLSLEIFERVFGSSALSGWEGFGVAVQAYLKRAPFVIDWLRDVARRGGRRMMVRLVKGAYWDSEVKRAQMLGLSGYPVYTRKCNTDVSYLACAARMIAAPRGVLPPVRDPQRAHRRHDPRARRARPAPGFQRLHGMGEDLYDEVVGMGHACRVYAPVGSHEDLLPYLVRRLLENGANTSFVNRIADSSIAIETVIADPVAIAEANPAAANPRIPLPSNLYPDRKNSGGFVFADEAVSAPFLAALQPLIARVDYAAAPLVEGKARTGKRVAIVDPASGRTIGRVDEADEAAVDAAVAVAARARVPEALERAQILERAADALEGHRVELIALLAREAGKTLPDALGEVREAADFCRYYALAARRHFAEPEMLVGPTGETNRLWLTGRGPFICISPWNFPLAIFVGQVAAAFAAGNPVIAKPAEQTPLVADLAVRLLHEAGVPTAAWRSFPAAAKSSAPARFRPEDRGGGIYRIDRDRARINRALAARDGPLVPFIAETGGLNAMLVDSSALPEQVVADVIASAFNSAGQRCSALRLLCLQKEIAPRVLEILEGATAELVLGDPLGSTPMSGPVIDREALATLEEHAARMDREARLVCQAGHPPAADVLRSARLRARIARSDRSRRSSARSFTSCGTTPPTSARCWKA
jgi:RHH-type proline utilization regulon transcriptional repressor/proline dehydrogenase/delta 1-pyrroline-5-carboxylate dehydrogenase